MKNTAENVHGGEVVPVEDQGVPSLPYVPKEEEHDVGTGLIWEGEFTAKCPWSAVLSRQWQVSKTKPNISRTWALNKNVSVVKRMDEYACLPRQQRPPLLHYIEASRYRDY